MKKKTRILVAKVTLIGLLTGLLYFSFRVYKFLHDPNILCHCAISKSPWKEYDKVPIMIYEKNNLMKLYKTKENLNYRVVPKGITMLQYYQGSYNKEGILTGENKVIDKIINSDYFEGGNKTILECNCLK